jgi:hypothetical protein
VPFASARRERGGIGESDGRAKRRYRSRLSGRGGRSNRRRIRLRVRQEPRPGLGVPAVHAVPPAPRFVLSADPHGPARVGPLGSILAERPPSARGSVRRSSRRFGRDRCRAPLALRMVGCLLPVRPLRRNTSGANGRPCPPHHARRATNRPPRERSPTSQSSSLSTDSAAPSSGTGSSSNPIPAPAVVQQVVGKRTPLPG